MASNDQTFQDAVLTDGIETLYAITEDANSSKPTSPKQKTRRFSLDPTPKVVVNNDQLNNQSTSGKSPKASNQRRNSKQNEDSINPNSQRRNSKQSEGPVKPNSQRRNSKQSENSNNSQRRNSKQNEGPKNLNLADNKLTISTKAKHALSPSEETFVEIDMNDTPTNSKPSKSEIKRFKANNQNGTVKSSLKNSPLLAGKNFS